MDDTKKAHRKVVEYIKNQIMTGKYPIGEKLPPERDLAELLGVSRNSVREAIRTLDIMGVVSSQQGAGNYIDDRFDQNLRETLSLMYILQKVDYKALYEFRHALEIQSMRLAVERATIEEINRLEEIVDKMEKSNSEETIREYDKQLHYSIAESSKNILIIDNLNALSTVIDSFIMDLRSKILTEERNKVKLQKAHFEMVQAIRKRDINKGVEALENHFRLIDENLNYKC